MRPSLEAVVWLHQFQIFEGRALLHFCMHTVHGCLWSPKEEENMSVVVDCIASRNVVSSYVYMF